MRNLLRFSGLLAFLAVLPAIHAADATGTWKGKFDFRGNSVPLTFHLTVADGAVTGTVEGLPTTPAEIHDGKVDGDTLTFWLNSEFRGQTYKLVYTGKVSTAGDEIAFKFGTEQKNWKTAMTAEKSTETGTEVAQAVVPAVAPTVGPGVAPTVASPDSAGAAPTAAPGVAPEVASAGPAVDVTGNWKATLDNNGVSAQVVFHLTSTDGALTGTVEGLPTTPTEIHDGKVDGDTVTFWVSTDYQGQTYKLMCTGKATAGQIVLNVGTDDGSWATQVIATKGT